MWDTHLGLLLQVKGINLFEFSFLSGVSTVPKYVWSAILTSWKKKVALFA